ncbi:MAG: hypothetical protein KJ890_15550 [Gammaproteobacteria bacterium]|nr:hypothetical protein [Gammaproteobacteria bacterium]MBU1803844.1 hypothetical protein [Gammaproteobacteria bacterium]
MPMSPHYQNTLYVDGVAHTVVREIPRTMADPGFQRVVLAKEGEPPSIEISIPATWYRERWKMVVTTGGARLSWSADL